MFGATGDDTASLRIVSLQEVTNFKQSVLHRWFSLAADWVMFVTPFTYCGCVNIPIRMPCQLLIG